IVRFVEKPPPGTVPSNLVSTGFYILEPEVLDYIENEKWDFAKDLFPYLMRLGKHLFGYTSDSFWVDVGELKGYLKGVNWVLRNFAADPPKDARLIGNPSEPVFARGDVKIGRGSQMLGPSWIDNETWLGENAQILPGSKLWPNTRVEEGDTVDGIIAVPRDKSFYFDTGLGQYSGILATSIQEFLDALKIVPLESLEYHIGRRDIEKWTKDVL